METTLSGTRAKINVSKIKGNEIKKNASRRKRRRVVLAWRPFLEGHAKFQYHRQFQRLQSSLRHLLFQRNLYRKPVSHQNCSLVFNQTPASQPYRVLRLEHFSPAFMLASNPFPILFQLPNPTTLLHWIQCIMYYSLITCLQRTK